MIRKHCDGYQNYGDDQWYQICTDIQSVSPYNNDRNQRLHFYLSNDDSKATQCHVQLWQKLGAYDYYGLQRYVVHFLVFGEEFLLTRVRAYCRGGLSNLAAGVPYGQYVDKYKAFMDSNNGENMHNGMAIYWNIPSM